MKKIAAFVLLSIGVAVFCAAQTASVTGTFKEEGIASWYGSEFDGRPTASGEIFDSTQFTAAHPTLPFGTTLTVTNVYNNKSVKVRVNDRGPFVSSRIIDLSRAAAEALGFLTTGTTPVVIETVPEPTPAAATPVTPEVVDPPAVTQAASPESAPITPELASAAPTVTQTPASAQNLSPFSAAASQTAQSQLSSAQTPSASAASQPTASQPAASQPTTSQPAAETTTPVTPTQTPAQTPEVTPTQTPAVQTAMLPLSSAPQPPATTTPLSPETPPEMTLPPTAQTSAEAASTPAATPSLQTPWAIIQLPTGSPAASAAETPTTPTAADPQPAAETLVPQITAAAAKSTPAPANIIGGIPATGTGKIYSLQVGSFRVPRNAVEVFEKLKNLGLNPAYERNDDLDMYRVIVTGLAPEEIPDVAGQLGELGLDTAVLREEK